MNRWFTCTLIVAAVCVASAGLLRALAEEKPATQSAKWAPAVQPKPLSENVKRGLAWLVKTQQPAGGWSQGEESAAMGAGSVNIRDTANVADTCAATLALIRAGSTPRQGEHAGNIRRGLEFICREIAEAEPQGLYVTKLRGTRLQQKLGPYIDTFLAAMVLAEVKDQMPDEKSRKQIMTALDKVMDKIEKNQKPDGTWAREGWAPTLSQAMASKAINRVSQSGVAVDETVRRRAEDYARSQFDRKNASFSADGSAGVALYAWSASLGAMQDSSNTNALMEVQARRKLQVATTQAEREEAKKTLDRIEATRNDLQQAQAAVVSKLGDERFIAGFGSNGGEEFLSYMNIGESLVVKGGPEWEKWDKSMTENLNQIQNQDGSWTGHHCITGRTFCTSAALLVLTVDRAPVPVAGQMRRR